MTSGTDEPRPVGGQPTDPAADPGPGQPAGPATEPWRMPAAASGDQDRPGEPAGPEPAGQQPLEVYPLPGGGWTSHPPHEHRDDRPAPAEPSSARPGAGSPASPGTGAGPGPMTSPRVAPATPRYADPPTRPAATRTMPAASRPAAPVRKGPRRARLTVRRVDPWSVLKFSFVYSLAGVVVLIVAAAVLYLIVDAMGVIDSVRTFLNDIEGGSSGLSDWLGFGRVMTVAIVLGIVNVVLFTAFATLTAFVYNICTEIVGGIELTLADTPSGSSTEVASSGGRGL